MSAIATEIQHAVSRSMQLGVRPDELFLGPEERRQLIEACNVDCRNVGATPMLVFGDGTAKYRGMTIRFLTNSGVRVGATFHGSKQNTKLSHG